MTAEQIAVRKNLYRHMVRLDEDNLRHADAFIRFLEYQQRLDDAEDIADAEARKDEPSVPMAEVEKLLSIA